MQVEVTVSVRAPRDAVWRVITDIENSPKFISGIEKVEILDRPASGFLGLKWRETRIMFGKEAVETMWIDQVSEGAYYTTEARSHGSHYQTKVYVEDEGGGTRLGMIFTGTAESTGAKLMSALLGGMMKGAVRKALLQDLNDIKAAVEREAQA